MRKNEQAGTSAVVAAWTVCGGGGGRGWRRRRRRQGWAAAAVGAGGGLMSRGSGERIRGEAGRWEGGYMRLLRLGFSCFDEPFVQS